MELLSSGFFLAVLAHAVLGASLVWDKVLLEETKSSSVVNYVFWLGAISVFGSILAIFGMSLPSLSVILTAFGAGALHLVAIYFYYWALKAGEASHTLAIMGGFSPVATALIAIPLLHSELKGITWWGFLLLTSGGFFMFFAERIVSRNLLALVVLSAGFYGLTNVLEKIAFNHAGFIAAYVFFTLGTFAASLVLLIPPRWRREILTQSEKAQPRNRFWYFVNRVINGVGSLLIFVAISRTNPALVDAISGLRYAIIFAGAYWLTKRHPQWLREEFHGWTVFAKSAATAIIIAGLVLVGLGDEDQGAISWLGHVPRILDSASLFRRAPAGAITESRYLLD